MQKNYLKAVFWDYPHLCDPKAIKKALNEARFQDDNATLYWIMARFLERGRFKDTASFFRPKEIKESLKSLRISSRARKRWERLLEVYGDSG
jgi:hypothetical protein